MIDQEFVQYIVSSLVSKPDKVRVDRIVDERGVLLTLHVDDEDLGRVIGRKGSTAQSLRVLLRALGSKNEAHYNLRIADDKEEGKEDDKEDDKEEGNGPSKPSPVEAERATDTDQPDDMVSDFADSDNPAEEEQEDTNTDSLLDKTKKELEDLNDLDI